jgi:hypothetical protein
MSSVTALVACVALAAAPTPDTARQLFDAGSQAYARGRYDDATRAFEAAYELLPDPAIAFSTAQAHRRRYFVRHDERDLLRAIELFARYLEQVEQGGRRADAVEQLQSLETVRAGLEPTATTPEDTPVATATELMVFTRAQRAEVAIDDGTFRALPTIAAVAPGSHRVRVRAPGYQAADTSATALEGRLMPLEVTLVEQPAKLSLSVRRGTRVEVDGRVVGTAPLSEPLSLAAGPHDVALSAPGRVSTTRAMTFSRGQHRTIAVDMPRTAQRDAAWAMIGTGAGLWLAGGTTLGFAFGFQRRAQRIEDTRGVRNIDTDELIVLEDSLYSRDQLRGATIGLWTGAAVTTAIGLVLMFTDRG